MPEREWEEIRRLRDWKHDDVDPLLLAWAKLLPSLNDRMDKVEAKVQAIAARDELADALADNLASRREVFYRRADFWIAVGMLAVAGITLWAKLSGG